MKSLALRPLYLFLMAHNLKTYEPIASKLLRLIKIEININCINQKLITTIQQ